MHILWTQHPLYVYSTQKTLVSHQDLNLPLLLFLRLLHKLLLSLALRFPLQLIRAANSDILGAEVAEHVLEDGLNQPATTVVKDHQHSQGHLELIAERHKAQPLVHLGHKLGRAGERNTRRGDKTPVHGFVFANGLAEGTALIVDGEG